MKYYNLECYGETYNVRLSCSRYMSNNTLAIELVADTGEPFCSLTTNIADSNIFANDTDAFVDTNNCPWAEQFIEENGLGKLIGYIGHSGFCAYPLYAFDLEKISKN